MRYEKVFLDVEGTMVKMDFDFEGFVRDLAPYSGEEALTYERASGPLQAGLREYVVENVKYPTLDTLNTFRHENARRTAAALELDAPPETMLEITDRRLSFELFPETVGVLEELKGLGLELYVLSNWDILLDDTLRELGIRDYFEGLIVSALVGYEKPDPEIFEEALRLSGADRSRAVHVGNDYAADVRGASGCGLDAVFVDRKSEGPGSAETALIPDLDGLPSVIRSQQ